ncbi:hypothetical protein KQH60_03160 [Mycetohabitans sp. B8]|uniref:hypothetical protein n=1 Tax=Mycetohabitans sp. B8 TaxID=2841845 RepID=UPI001F2F9830|nr:hypothetical protein [Mycetohabitans sp. B8]MCG1041625.1 hypothetical protein [Mycetohabitans sp. B8]
MATHAFQAALFAQWRDAPLDGPGPDLGTVTQPQLDALDATMLLALACVQARRGTPDCPIRVARALADRKTMTVYDASRCATLRTAMSHLCTTGGVGAVG